MIRDKMGLLCLRKITVLYDDRKETDKSTYILEENKEIPYVNRRRKGL